MATLTVEQRERKEEAKAEREKARLAAAKVTIKRIERTKRKHVTAIHGLESFDIDLKKVAKSFASRFATGSSVSKNNQGEDEIVIQGDVAYEVEELMLDADDKKAAAMFEGKIAGDQIDIVDEKKKKKAAQ